MINQGLAKVEEVVSVLIPEPGVSLDQALADAQIEGAEVVELDREKNQATIRWFKRDPVKELWEIIRRVGPALDVRVNGEMATEENLRRAANDPSFDIDGLHRKVMQAVNVALEIADRYRGAKP